jgi:hypothetical protein
LGSIDSRNDEGKSVILDAHPRNEGVLNNYYTFSFADAVGQKVVGKLMRQFDKKDVEGLDFTEAGRPVFVRDRKGGCTVLFE